MGMESFRERGKGQKVVLDTNALLMPFEFPLNLDLELRSLLGNCSVVVPGPVIGELKRLRSRKAAAAIALARNYDIVDTSRQGDDGVIDVATRLGAVVLTNDTALRARLRKMGIRTIRLKSNDHLVLDD